MKAVEIGIEILTRWPQGYMYITSLGSLAVRAQVIGQGKQAIP